MDEGVEDEEDPFRADLDHPPGVQRRTISLIDALTRFPQLDVDQFSERTNKIPRIWIKVIGDTFDLQTIVGIFESWEREPPSQMVLEDIHTCLNYSEGAIDYKYQFKFLDKGDPTIVSKITYFLTKYGEIGIPMDAKEVAHLQKNVISVYKGDTPFYIEVRRVLGDFKVRKFYPSNWFDHLFSEKGLELMRAWKENPPHPMILHQFRYHLTKPGSQRNAYCKEDSCHACNKFCFFLSVIERGSKNYDMEFLQLMIHFGGFEAERARFIEKVRRLQEICTGLI